MKEIKLTIPEGCKTVTVKMDGEQVITEFEPKEEKWIPKGGDIIAYKFGTSNMNIGIFKKSCGHTPEGYSLHEDYVTIGGDTGELFFGGKTFIQEYIRLATEEEKQRLFDAIAKEGKRWNAEKKQIEDLPRWRAEINWDYYFINSRLKVAYIDETGHEVDNENYSIGNYFKTKEAAERVAKQIREIFKNSKAE